MTNNGKYLISGSFDKTVRLWNFYERSLEYIFNGHTSFVVALALSNDNIHFVSRSHDETIILWNLLEKNIVSEWPCPYTANGSLLFTNNNKYILSCGGSGHNINA